MPMHFRKYTTLFLLFALLIFAGGCSDLRNLTAYPPSDPNSREFYSLHLKV